MQYCMRVGLGQQAEPPTQTIERVEKALETLQCIERFPCDQHDHISFAKAWMLMGKGVAHALDHDFRLVPPAVMAPLQRRLEGGPRQTLTVLLGSEVSEWAWERAKLPTCFGGLGIRVAQMGFAAQATYWSAVDLHKTVLTKICEALNRPIREMHAEIAAALSAKTDLLLSGVAVDEHAKVTIENEAGKLYEASPWVAGKRAADRVPPKAWRRTWRSSSCSRGFCRLRKRFRLRSNTVRCFQNSRPRCSVQGEFVLDGHAQVTDRTATECAMEDGNGAATRCDTRCRPAICVCSA